MPSRRRRWPGGSSEAKNLKTKKTRKGQNEDQNKDRTSQDNTRKEKTKQEKTTQHKRIQNSTRKDNT